MLFLKIIGLLLLILLIVAAAAGEMIGVGWILMQVLNAFGVEIGLLPPVGIVVLFQFIVVALKGLTSKK